MGKKRLFQILDEINVADIENKTQHVKISNSIISMDQNKKGIKITIGVPLGTVNVSDFLFEGKSNQRIVLLVVDGDEYDKKNI